MTKQQQLEQLKKLIETNQPCKELAAQATQLVFGSGNVDAEVVFIGEAPGKNEDLTGEPFVGAAGKFLDEMLASVGLNRADIYITNIVKYRPPDNRDPLPEEKEEFWPYLLKQLAIIQPKIIVTLGRHSGQAFLKSLRISADHGKPHRIKVVHPTDDELRGHLKVNRERAMQGETEQWTEPYEHTVKGIAQDSTQQRASRSISADSSAGRQDSSTIILLPLYHPAAALYNGSLRATLLEDFQSVAQLLKA